MKISSSAVKLPIYVCKCYEEAFRFSSEFKRKFKSYVQKYDIVFIHGLWRFPTSYAAFSCRKLGRPYVIFTHAMLSPWSMAQKKLSKSIYYWLVEKSNLNGAAKLAVMNEDEIGMARKYGIQTEVSFFASGVNREDIVVSGQKLKEKAQKPSKDFKLLFLSRIHRKKGLLFLMKALKDFIGTNLELKLTVAGPVEDSDYYKEIINFIKKNHLQDNVFFIGVISGEEKKNLFQEADVFVLPSADEGGSPLVVLEAMSYALPAVVTPGCKMPDIDNRMGYVVSQNSHEIAGAIRKLVESKELAEKMGMNGQRYVLENFTWEKLIQEIINMAEDVIGRGKA